MTELQAAFIRLDTHIQEVGDKNLQQVLIYDMIEVMNALAKPELEEYFNVCRQEEDSEEISQESSSQEEA